LPVRLSADRARLTAADCQVDPGAARSQGAWPGALADDPADSR